MTNGIDSSRMINASDRTSVCLDVERLEQDCLQLYVESAYWQDKRWLYVYLIPVSLMIMGASLGVFLTLIKIKTIYEDKRGRSYFETKVIIYLVIALMQTFGAVFCMLEGWSNMQSIHSINGQRTLVLFGFAHLWGTLQVAVTQYASMKRRRALLNNATKIHQPIRLLVLAALFIFAFTLSVVPALLTCLNKDGHNYYFSFDSIIYAIKYYVFIMSLYILTYGGSIIDHIRVSLALARRQFIVSGKFAPRLIFRMWLKMTPIILAMISNLTFAGILLTSNKDEKIIDYFYITYCNWGYIAALFLLMEATTMYFKMKKKQKKRRKMRERQRMHSSCKKKIFPLQGASSTRCLTDEMRTNSALGGMTKRQSTKMIVVQNILCDPLPFDMTSVQSSVVNSSNIQSSVMPSSEAQSTNESD